jgi:putative hydrolase of the HAD superfamily
VKPIPRPKAFLLDLDDTILDDSNTSDECWRDSCQAFEADMRGISVAQLMHALDEVREWYWSDRDRHRRGRLDLPNARREITGMSLRKIGIDDPALSRGIADRYALLRETMSRPFPGAIETVHWLRESGCSLALLTNGDGVGQRRKVSRFGLSELFDTILIEGEVGFGTPDTRIYERALKELQVSAADTWMVGDNLEWDVVAPQKMGIIGVWMDVNGKGLPTGSDARPHHVLQTLSGLRELLAYSR